MCVATSPRLDNALEEGEETCVPKARDAQGAAIGHGEAVGTIGSSQRASQDVARALRAHRAGARDGCGVGPSVRLARAGAIGLADVDGAVELNGCFPWLEWKASDAPGADRPAHHVRASGRVVGLRPCAHAGRSLPVTFRVRVGPESTPCGRTQGRSGGLRRVYAPIRPSPLPCACGALQARNRGLVSPQGACAGERRQRAAERRLRRRAPRGDGQADVGCRTPCGDRLPPLVVVASRNPRRRHGVAVPACARDEEAHELDAFDVAVVGEERRPVPWIDVDRHLVARASGGTNRRNTHRTFVQGVERVEHAGGGRMRGRG